MSSEESSNGFGAYLNECFHREQLFRYQEGTIEGYSMQGMI